MTDAALVRLREALSAGFRDARLPRNVDEIADDWEVPEVRNLVGNHWSHIPLASISRMNWDLGWFKLHGIRHYLPAFMMAAANGEDETAETTIKYLQSGAGEREGLWPDEKRAVRSWLRYMRDELANEDAARALATYWENPPISALDEERVALFRRAQEVFAPERTPPEAGDLAKSVHEILERDSGSLWQHVSAATPHYAAQRAPLVRALSTDQLLFIVDLLDFSHRRWPAHDDEATLQFWREQLAARGS